MQRVEVLWASVCVDCWEGRGGPGGNLATCLTASGWSDRVCEQAHAYGYSGFLRMVGWGGVVR